MQKDFVYLASASPRRCALLQQIGVAFEVRPAGVEEDLEPGEEPERYVRRLAEAKAAAVRRTLGDGLDARPVLGADTAVVLDGRVLGKPADDEAALEMLAALSGRAHRVLTGVSVHGAGGPDSLVNVSEVRFRPTTQRERRAYCASGEPFDKAGGYGIQGLGAVFVEHLSGSYSGVMGLPLCETAVLLGRAGIGGWWAQERAGR